MALRKKGHGAGGLGTADLRLNVGTRERKAELLAVCEVLGFGLSEYIKRAHEAYLATLSPEVAARVREIAQRALAPDPVAARKKSKAA